MKISDCFMYFNEGAVCLLRLQYLQDSIESFIVVEGTHTFTGKPRRLEFEANILSRLDRFPKLQRKIRYVPIDMSKFEGTENPWDAEKYLRNSISEHLDPKCDMTICSDCDEVPSLKWVSEIKKMGSNSNATFSVVSGEMLTFYGSCKNLMFGSDGKPSVWKGSFAACKNSFKIWEVDYIRRNIAVNLALKMPNNQLHEPQTCSNGGWHLSYFGGKNQTIDKLDSFSHQEQEIKAHSANVHSSTSIGQDPFMRELHFRLPLPEELFPPTSADELNKELGYPAFNNEELLLASIQRMAEDSRSNLKLLKDIAKKLDAKYEKITQTTSETAKILDTLIEINNNIPKKSQFRRKIKRVLLGFVKKITTIF